MRRKWALLLIAIMIFSGAALYKFAYGYRDGKNASMKRYNQEKIISSTIVEPFESKEILQDVDKGYRIITQYKIPFLKGELIINSVGNGSFKDKKGNIKEFLFKPDGKILRLMYCLYRNDLILCFDVINGEKAWSCIARIESGSLETSYMEKIEGYNIFSIMQDRFVYFSTAETVGKFDVDKPGIAWINRDLFEKNKVSYYDKVAIYKDIAVFESTQNVDENGSVIIACEKKDGSEKEPIFILETIHGGGELCYRYNRTPNAKTICYRPLPINDFKKYLPSDMKKRINTINKEDLPFKVDEAYAIIFTSQKINEKGPKYNVQVSYMGGDNYNPDFFIATITKTDKNPLEGVNYKAVDTDDFGNSVYVKKIGDDVQLFHHISDKAENTTYSYYVYDNNSNCIRTVVTVVNEIYCYKNGLFYRFGYNANKNKTDPKYIDVMERKAVSFITGDQEQKDNR